MGYLFLVKRYRGRESSRPACSSSPPSVTEQLTAVVVPGAISPRRHALAVAHQGEFPSASPMRSGLAWESCWWS
jgi:hypothetical protein